ncbi:MAG: TylF/MycF/NovP-related O-methyltransferase [Rhodothalassiaceae bacterium]
MTSISQAIAEQIEQDQIPLTEVVGHFPRFTRSQAVARMAALYELFKLVQPVKGCILECGVHHGAGLFTWAHLSARLEPFNTFRRIYGFDTFQGFPTVDDRDQGAERNDAAVAGAFKGSALQDLQQSVDLFHQFNPQCGERVFLVPGDATKTIPRFVEDNPHLIVSLLFLDFDLYEPTRVALDHLVPRMPQGAVLCFDEINNPHWPGETRALTETLGVGNLTLRSFPFEPNIAYAVL